MTPTEQFIRQVRARSTENKKAIRLLHSEHLSAQIVAILRQELDSLVRVIYILSARDRSRRAELIVASVEGRKWKRVGSNKTVTDREMVDLAQQLHGWTQSVYRFGCAFIHLSSFHDYHHRDPMAAIHADERTAILQHMRHYHGGPANNSPSFQDLVPFLPNVFEKISSNLECYLEMLANNEDIDNH